MARIDRTVSAIGFGAFKIGRNQGIKYPHAYKLPSQREAGNLLNGLLDLGITYIDTAPAYGLSEERIGQAIAHRRREYLLSTKVGETFVERTSRHDYREPAIRHSVRQSLQRLRTEVLDLVYVHSNGEDLRILESTDVVPTLLRMRDEGWIRKIGFSGYTEAGFLAALPWCDAIMVTYHQQDRTLEPVIQQAGRQGVAVMVKKGLASGRLPADEAISFVLGNQDVTSMVIGTLNLEHFRSNLTTARRIRRVATALPASPPSNTGMVP